MDLPGGLYYFFPGLVIDLDKQTSGSGLPRLQSQLSSPRETSSALSRGLQEVRQASLSRTPLQVSPWAQTTRFLQTFTTAHPISIKRKEPGDGGTCL